MDYKVKFDVFEGPLDLLLHLIKKEEVDIYEVNLTKLASGFIEYLDVMRLFDLDIAGEFLVMASTLMYIKSRELLPIDRQVALEGEEEEEDPRWQLIRQLVEYKKFKDAAGHLQEMERRQEHVFPHLPSKPEFDEPADRGLGTVSIFDLINAVNTVLKRVQDRDNTREIFDDKWTVSEKIESLAETVGRRGRMRFSELFARATSRTEVVVTFLALLELIRLRKLAVCQRAPFEEIEISTWDEAEPVEAAASAPVPLRAD